MARAAVRAFIPCRRVAAPGVVSSSEIAGFLPPVGNAHLADRNDRNPHLRPTPAGVQAQPRRSRGRRLGERIASGRRAQDGGWESLEGRQFWTGKALPRQLRFVVKHPLRKPPSRPRSALETLCKVGSIWQLFLYADHAFCSAMYFSTLSAIRASAKARCACPSQLRPHWATAFVSDCQV